MVSPEEPCSAAACIVSAGEPDVTDPVSDVGDAGRLDGLNLL
jgi:hypothetical protein